MRRGVLVIAAVAAVVATMPGAAHADPYGCSASAQYGTDLPNVPAESPTPAITCSFTYPCPAYVVGPCHPDDPTAFVTGDGQIGAWVYAGGGRVGRCDAVGLGGGCWASVQSFDVPAGTTVTFTCGVRNYVAANIKLSCYFAHPGF